jgi:hypothetical protein
LVSDADVEREIMRLFTSSTSGGHVVVRVHGDDRSPTSRRDAFRELLESLAMYDERYRHGQQVLVEPPSFVAIRQGLGVLGDERLKRRLFEQVLKTFGARMIDPLGEMLDTMPGGALLTRMEALREQILGGVDELGLTHETQQILRGDLRRLLTEDYLVLLAEHEENVQRPRVKELAKEVLQLIGETFQRAFRHWPAHAERIAESVARRLGQSVELKENPGVIRTRIVEGVEEFLWVETSTDLSGALTQLFRQQRYAGLIAGAAPEPGRDIYHEFALTCWDLIEGNC